MTSNTRKHTRSVYRYLFTIAAVAFVLTIVAVNASVAQSSAYERDNPQSSAKQPYPRVTGNVTVDQPTLLIDSFKVGPYSTPLVASGGKKLQTLLDGGEVIGGSRATFLAIENPDKQSVSFEVRTSKPALILSAGYHVYPRLELTYTVPSVSADLISKYDRFLIDFDGLDHGINLSITVFGADPKVAPHTGEVCTVLPPEGPFTLSFPFARFQAPGVLKSTNGITFIFQFTSGGLDYAITRITAAKGSPVGKHMITCSK